MRTGEVNDLLLCAKHNTNGLPEDEQFIDEKAFLTKQIEALQPQPRMVQG